jgi:O-antigen/teichoic acid export membrane protein
MFTLYGATFFLFELYGPREVGYFAFAFRLAALPMALLASSLSEVFFQKAAQSVNSDGTFWKPMRFNLLVAGGFSLLIFIATILLARIAVRIYLGAEWDPVATVLIILAPMMAGRFLLVALASAPLVTGHTGWLLAANLALAAATVGAYVAAKILSLGFTDYLALSSWLSAALYALVIAVIVANTYRRYRRPVSEPQRKRR